MSKRSIQEKKKLGVLDLERVNNKSGKLSEHIYLERLKKDKNIKSAKKIKWKLRKIITEEGNYFPEKGCSVILLSSANSERVIKRKTISKHKMLLTDK